MLKYIIRKAVGWLVVVFLATNIAYFLATTFLDPRSNYQGRRPPLTPDQIQDILEPLNLSDRTPLLERWWTWLTNILLHWDWGLSPVNTPVADEVSYRIWVSARLLFLSAILAIVIGVAVGVYTASRQYQLGDRVFQGLAIITMNIHIVVASVVVVSVGLWLNKVTGTHLVYVTGDSNTNVTGLLPGLVDFLQHVALPTVALIITSYASYHLTQRTLLLDNLGADYVRTARAKGLTRHQAIRKHALRTSIIPVATSVAFSIPGIFTGAVMTERIFAWRGMGTYFIETIGRNDVHGAVAVAAFGAAMTAVSAVLADIIVVAVDPRVRVS